MAEEFSDRNDPELKYLSVERSQFNDPATQAEWTQKRLVWVPHDNQVRNEKMMIEPEQNRNRTEQKTANKHLFLAFFKCVRVGRMSKRETKEIIDSQKSQTTPKYFLNFFLSKRYYFWLTSNGKENHWVSVLKCDASTTPIVRPAGAVIHSSPLLFSLNHVIYHRHRCDVVS